MTQEEINSLDKMCAELDKLHAEVDELKHEVSAKETALGIDKTLLVNELAKIEGERISERKAIAEVMEVYADHMKGYACDHIDNVRNLASRILAGEFGHEKE